MPNIPDKQIIRGVKNVMKGDGKLDNTEAGSEMAHLGRNHIDDERSEFGSQVIEIFNS